jgi:5'-nucleotidase
MNFKNIFFLSSLFLFFSQTAQCRLLQIIHTNDLHSHFTGYNDGRGGYARVMAKIKEIRASAREKNIEVLQVDAGDWGEGTAFFHGHEGVDSLKALEMLGAEVATIGNHDHLMGPNALSKMLRAADIKTKFVVANLVTTPEMELDNLLSPSMDLERGGIKIRIIGLTTPESWFQYSMFPGKVSSPYSIGESLAKKAKADGRELVIALSHLGLYADESLAANSSHIDVIIGGHTHTRLSKVDYIKNRAKEYVPIVQASGHTLAIGSLLIDLKDDGEVDVVEYKLHDINDSIKPDSRMQDFVESAITRRNQNFENRWDEVLGESKVSIAGYANAHPVYRTSCWGWHFATAARKITGAAVGIHLSPFEGLAKQPGPVTFGDVVDSFPHVRKFGDPGWEIVTTTIPALKLRAAMYWVSRKGYGVTFSGLGYKDIPEDDKGVYTVAFPAEVALAIQRSFPAYRQYLTGLKHTGKYYWPVMMDYVKDNSPLKCR